MGWMELIGSILGGAGKNQPKLQSVGTAVQPTPLEISSNENNANAVGGFMSLLGGLKKKKPAGDKTAGALGASDLIGRYSDMG